MINKNLLKIRAFLFFPLLLALIYFSPVAYAQTATLTLNGQVVNDDGGTAVISDFLLQASGPDYISGFSGQSSVTNATVLPGVYDLFYNRPVGYDTGFWDCDGGSLDVYTLTIVENEAVTCTATIHDIIQDLEWVYLSGADYTREGSANILTEVYNRGLFSSDSYQISYRRSADTLIDTSDIELDLLEFPSLAPGETNFFGYSLAFPPAYADTTPYWGYCIINAGAEATSDNNCSDYRTYPSIDGRPAPSTCPVTPLGCGSTISGDLDTSDCELGPRGTPVGDAFTGTADFLAQRYEFEGTAGQTVSIFADWLYTVDGYLYLENPLGVIEELDDDYQGIDLSLIENHVLEHTGTYKIWTTTYGSQRMGSFDLTLSCDGVVVDPVTINQFSVSPSEVSEGQEVTLSWSSEGAGYCYGVDGVAAWQGEKAISGTQSVVVEAAGLNTFKLHCANETGGEATATASVNVLGSNPDLKINSVSLSSSVVDTNEYLVTIAVFKNIGDGISAESTVRYYLSDNEAISESDELMGTDTLKSLSPEGFGSENRGAPAPLVAGQYWIGVCVDPVEGEPDITNNCSLGVPLAVQPRASCAISSLECGATNIGALGVQDCQSGPLGAGRYAAGHVFEGAAGQSFILDVDWAGGDGYVALEGPDGVIVSANDDFGDSRHSRIEVKLPMSGAYTTWLTTFATGTDPGFELSMACPDQSEPNLAVTLEQGPPDAFEVGDAFRVEFDVGNVGESTAGSSTLRYLLSTNATISDNDLQLDTSSVSSLSPGSIVARSASLEVVEPGDYWLGACVDSVAGESLDGNNCSEGQRFTVRSSSACSAGSISFGQNAQGNLTAADCDKSPRGAAYPSESFSFSGSKGQTIALGAEWNDVDGYLYLQGPDGKVLAQNDDAQGYGIAVTRSSGKPSKTSGNKQMANMEAVGDEQSSEIIVKLPESGTYTAWATTYGAGSAGSYQLSLDELALCAGELTIDSISPDKTIVSDTGQVTVSTQVSYSSCGEEGGSEEAVLRYFVSSNSKITSGDAEVGVDVIETLQNGGSRTEQVLVQAPVTSGKYWVGACINEINDDCVVSAPVEVQSSVESIPFNSGMNDAWWTPTQPGQGMLVTVFPATNLIFIAWFTFDTELPAADAFSNLGDAGHRWMTAYGTYSGNSATLRIEMTRGGIFNSTSPPIQQNVDGTVQIQFTDCDRGTIQYDIPSIDQQGTVEIQRVTRENLHLCESGLTDNQQLQSSISIEATPAVVRTGERAIINWQAPANLNCVSTGGIGRWAEGMELDSSGSQKVRVNTEGNHDFGMTCSNGSSIESSASVNAKLTAVNPEGNQVEKYGQKVLFNPGLNDAWFDPNTPGQGALLTIFPDTRLVFLAWFTFDTQRPPGNTPFNLGDPGHRWVTAFGFYDEDSAQLQIELTKGGIFDSALPQVTQESYGTMDLSFENCDDGEMAYNIPSVGLSGTIPLKRGAPDKIEECQAQDGFDDPINVQIQPAAKKQLPNSCGGSYTWNFEWEEQYGFNRYQVEIRNGRSDEPVYREYVQSNLLTIQKSEPVSPEYLNGWTWRVRAIGGTISGPWSESREFNVAPLTACN